MTDTPAAATAAEDKPRPTNPYLGYVTHLVHRWTPAIIKRLDDLLNGAAAKAGFDLNGNPRALADYLSHLVATSDRQPSIRPKPGHNEALLLELLETWPAAVRFVLFEELIKAHAGPQARALAWYLNSQEEPSAKPAGKRPTTGRGHGQRRRGPSSKREPRSKAA